jgi:hypothetical protein
MSSSTDNPNDNHSLSTPAPTRSSERHNAAELRLARTRMAQDLSHRLSEMFTSVVLKCDMAILEATAGNPVTDYLVAIKRATIEAGRLNHRLEGVLRECKEATR